MITRLTLRDNHPYALGFALPEVEEAYKNDFVEIYKGTDWAVHGYDELHHQMVFSAFHGQYKDRYRYWYMGLYLPLYHPLLGEIIVYDARYIDW